MPNKKHSYDPNTFVGIVLLFCFVILPSHALLLISDGVTWDGWIDYGLFLNHDFNTFLGMLREIGNPFIAYYYAMFWVFPNLILTYKIFGFLCILLSTFLVYLITKRIHCFSPSESLFIAAIFGCYTGYQAYSLMCTIFELFFYAPLFLLGIFLLFDMLDINYKLHSFQRIVLLSIFFLSFQLNSLLLYYFPFLVLVLLKRIHDRGQIKNIRNLFRETLTYLDFFLLPFLYWTIKSLFFRPYGKYLGYNQINFTPHTLLLGFKIFLKDSILIQFSMAWNLFIKHIYAHPFFLTGSLVIVFLGIDWIFRNYLKINVNKSVNANYIIKYEILTIAILLVAAFILLVAAIFPYIAVRKYGAISGFDTRNAELISIPVSIILVSIGRFFNLIIPYYISKYMVRFFSFFCVTIFIFSTINIYIEWQSRWIKDRSIITNLQKMNKKSFQQINFVLVSDPSQILGPRSYYEYSGMFKLAWGTERLVGSEYISDFYSIKKYNKNNLKLYLLKDWKKQGCQAILNISTNIPENHTNLVLSYYKYLWFYHIDLPNFLASLTTIKLKELPCGFNLSFQQEK